MKVANHKLPDELLRLIENKEYGDLPFISMATLSTLIPSDVQVLGGAYGGLRFFDLEGIKREANNPLLGNIKPEARNPLLDKAYAIDSSNLRNKPITDLHILDIDKALFIAGNHDEESIALDYRIDPFNPRVLGSFHPKEWVLLAESFPEFLEKLNL